MQVGTKELKNRLSYYLRRVRQGDVVHVTDHGTPVAELRPLPSAHGPDGRALQALERDGLVTTANGPKADFAPIRIKRAGRGSRIIIEDRK
jgi:prevent-host-death family protein